MPKRLQVKGDSEENKLFELIRKVKYKNDEFAYDKVRAYMNSYIEMFKKKYIIAGLGIDDIEQECLFALRYKAIDDFNPTRGTFKTFAVLCIKRHLFSIIKGNNQNKKKVSNIAISIDESRKHRDGEELSLRNIIADDSMGIDEQLEKKEEDDICQSKLIIKLSDFEKEVFILYKQKYRYDEIVDELNKNGRKTDRKAIDNNIQRIKQKAKGISEE